MATMDPRVPGLLIEEGGEDIKISLPLISWVCKLPQGKWRGMNDRIDGCRSRE